MPILHSPLFSSFPEISHGTSMKDFGPLVFTTDNNAEEIITNRIHLLEEFNSSLANQIYICNQIHGDKIHVVSSGATSSLGFLDPNFTGTDGDAIITCTKGINLVVTTADCLPVFLYDTRNHVVALVHSGSKGSLLRITTKVIKRMQGEFGTKVNDLYVYVGPSIGPCHYDARYPDQIDAFEHEFHNVVHRDEKSYIDLWDSLEQEIREVGIPASNFENCKICSVCHSDQYESFRASGGSWQRNMNMIALR